MPRRDGGGGEFEMAKAKGYANERQAVKRGEDKVEGPQPKSHEKNPQGFWNSSWFNTMRLAKMALVREQDVFRHFAQLESKALHEEYSGHHPRRPIAKGKEDSKPQRKPKRSAHDLSEDGFVFIAILVAQVGDRGNDQGYRQKQAKGRQLLRIGEDPD